MTTASEQIQKYQEFQNEILEPMRAFGGIAIEAFERFTRQNYAVLGDYIEFAVEQAKLPSQVNDVNAYLGQQMAHTRAFGEKLARRAQEYAEIAQSAQLRTQDATAAAVGDKRTPKKAA
jgi:hypothetical protein